MTLHSWTFQTENKMAVSLRTLWFSVAVFLVLMFATVQGDETTEKETKAWLKTKVNAVTTSCPHGETFYRACVRCVCEATLSEEALAQFPAHHLDVCAGKVAPTDCPTFTCETSKKFLAPTPCEDTCVCNSTTNISTCKKHPCPYE